MFYLGLLAVSAIVHILIVKDLFSIHTLLVDIATRFPIGMSTVVVNLLHCPMCLGFWIGIVLCFLCTFNIIVSIVFGLACYGLMAIVSSLVEDFKT